MMRRMVSLTMGMICHNVEVILRLTDGALRLRV